MSIEINEPFKIRTSGTTNTSSVGTDGSQSQATVTTNDAREAVLKSLYGRRDALVDLEPSDLVELELSEIDSAIDHWEATEARSRPSNAEDRVSEYKAITSKLMAIQARLERGQ